MKIELDPAKTAELVMMPPPILPPAYRSIQTTNLEPKKRKKCLRVAAGVIWDDPKLAEWDPSGYCFLDACKNCFILILLTIKPWDR